MAAPQAHALNTHNTACCKSKVSIVGINQQYRALWTRIWTDITLLFLVYGPFRLLIEKSKTQMNGSDI